MNWRFHWRYFPSLWHCAIRISFCLQDLQTASQMHCTMWGKNLLRVWERVLPKSLHSYWYSSTSNEGWRLERQWETQQCIHQGARWAYASSHAQQDCLWGQQRYCWWVPPLCDNDTHRLLSLKKLEPLFKSCRELTSPILRSKVTSFKYLWRFGVMDGTAKLQGVSNWAYD